MAKNLDLKISYVRVTEYGLETRKGELLSSLSDNDKKEVKVISFLPINYDGVLDITEYLDGFTIAETLNLPSMMTTTMKKAKEICPLLQEIVMLNRRTTEQSLDGNVVSIVGKEIEGDNDTKFRSYVTSDKEGTIHSYVLNPVHIDNHSIVIEEKVIDRLSIANVSEYVSGEKGLINLINEINASIEDSRCRIDVSEEMIESLLYIFIEKGVSFEQFTIDFSKLYDKIESYKSLTRNINQVSIKEDVETCIVETYQKLRQTVYNDMLRETSLKLSKLVDGSNDTTQDLLMSDMSSFMINLLISSPDFDEDYREGDTVNQILNEMIILMPNNIRTSKGRNMLKKALEKAVNYLKSDKEKLYENIESCLESKVSIEWVRDKFVEAFNLDMSRKPARNMASKFIDSLTKKNFETLCKNDIIAIIDKIKVEMGDGEIRSKEMIEIINRVIETFPTKEEIKKVLLDVIAKNGYLVANKSNN